MTKRINTRLKDLEKKVQPKEPTKVIVDWDPEPSPEVEGVHYVYWDDVIEDEKENDQED